MMFEDLPEGYERYSDVVLVDGEPVERLCIEIWKSGNVWKWSVTRMWSGGGPEGTAKTRKEAIEKALDAFERMKREIEEIVRFEGGYYL